MEGKKQPANQVFCCSLVLVFVVYSAVGSDIFSHTNGFPFATFLIRNCFVTKPPVVLYCCNECVSARPPSLPHFLQLPHSQALFTTPSLQLFSQFYTRNWSIVKLNDLSTVTKPIRRGSETQVFSIAIWGSCYHPIHRPASSVSLSFKYLGPSSRFPLQR